MDETLDRPEILDSNMLNEAPPLIVTLELESEAWSYFEALRREHFPATRNHIPAHLTLFHKLPGHSEQSIAETLRHATELTRRFPLEAYGLMRLGRGVAFRIRSDRLHSLHNTLWTQWIEWLTPQDRQPFRPHIVVQNKVEPQHARTLFAALSATFKAFTFDAAGLHLWRYLGGDWDSIALFPFLP